MKNMYWKKVMELDRKTSKVTLKSVSLIEYLPIDSAMIFWGSIHEDEGEYEIVARSKDRALKTIEEKLTSLKDAQDAIEKFLFDEGVLEEGDEIGYL